MDDSRGHDYHLEAASVVKEFVGGVGTWVLDGRMGELLEAVTGSLR